jgi:hypothetical protein
MQRKNGRGQPARFSHRRMSGQCKSGRCQDRSRGHDNRGGPAAVPGQSKDQHRQAEEGDDRAVGHRSMEPDAPDLRVEKADQRLRCGRRALHAQRDGEEDRGCDACRKTVPPVGSRGRTLAIDEDPEEAAADPEQECGVEQCPHRSCNGRPRRNIGIAGNARGQSGIRCRRPDREDEAAADRMGIGGDHSIGDDIAADTQVFGQPDSYGLVGLRYVLGSGDRLAGGVEDADGDR